MMLVYLFENQQYGLGYSKAVLIAFQLPNETQSITGWGRFFSDRVGVTFM